MKRSHESVLPLSGTLLALPLDLLSHLAHSQYLDPYSRACYRLVCRATRQAVRARREQLHWYTYKRWFDAYNTTYDDELGREIGRLATPGVFVKGFRCYVMCVLPVRLALCTGDKWYTICHDDGNTVYDQPDQWWPRVGFESAIIGYRPQDRHPLTRRLAGENDDTSTRREEACYHCRFMYLPILDTCADQGYLHVIK